MSNADKGLAGVVAADTALSSVDGENGVLIYRGYDILDLGGNTTFEEIIYLLWEGRLPNAIELAAFSADLATHRALPAAVATILNDMPRAANPTAVLRTAVSAMGLVDPTADDITVAGGKAKSAVLTAVIPTIIAAWERIRRGQEVVAPRADLGHTANFLYMLSGDEPNPDAVKALDTYLVLLADHGFNASTFAARVTTGTWADVYSAITTAIGTLKGHAHGGATQKAMEQFIAADARGGADAWFKEIRANDQRVMGIGHRVYKVEDPRAKILRPLAEKLANSSGRGKWFEIASSVEKLARQDEYFIERNLFANVDYYASVVLFMIDLPTDQFTNLFAMSRVSGWTAHVIEQLADNRLIRPKARYVGEEGLTFVPLANR